jgi:hypothetical protein
VSTSTAAGAFLIGLPLAFNLVFGLLAARFDYPDILRRPTGEVLAAFRAGGTPLVLLWWAFAATALLLAPLAVLTAAALRGADATLLTLSLVIGVVAALVQLLGLIRWPFLVPYLARLDGEADATPARREAIDVVFQSFNRYLGVGVGEHLGYGLTGAWSILSGAAAIQSTVVPAWLGAVGMAAGGALVLCAFEFVGPHERDGWKPAGWLTPVAYVVWSLWLIALGVGILA